MSEVYVLEPPTFGKVVLHTSHGPLDVELWSKECPKTCLNFVQLCIDGYYDGCVFHRIIPDFIVQTGDPTGTGLGGESIYGNEPFPTELHPRLAFRYRGMIGLAASNADDRALDPDLPNEKKYGSQFFITLARADSLNRQNTLFAKVTGHSLYNLLTIAESAINPKTFVPLDPPKINSVQIILSPYEDLHPRPHSKAALQVTASQSQNEQSKSRPKNVPVRKPHLLSFEDQDTLAPSSTPVSAHTCSKPPPDDRPASEKPSATESERVSRSLALKQRIQSHMASQAQSHNSPDQSSSEASDVDDNEKLETQRVESEVKSLASNYLALKRDGQGTKRSEDHKLEAVEDADLISESEKRRRYHTLKKRNLSENPHQDQILKRLTEFQLKLRGEAGKEQDWLGGRGLDFGIDSSRAYELDAAHDSLIVVDPLVNLSKEELKEKMRRLNNMRMKPSLKSSSKS